MALAGILALWAGVSLSQSRSEAGFGPGLRPLVVNLNRAPARRLVLLPGIGPVRAAAIVADRRQRGPYPAIENLARVHGIGPATVHGLRGRARVR